MNNLLGAIDKPTTTFFRDVFLSEELMTTFEVIVHFIFTLLKNTIRETILKQDVVRKRT
jgi:hypothetical protein